MKKTIKVAYLYYDLMNLYGEVGNIRAFKNFCEREGANVSIDKLTIGDKIDFKKYDFYYIGCGSEENLYITLEDILKYRKDIIKAIDNGKFILATGNAMELFGKKIRTKDGRNIPCLDIIDYQSYEKNERIVGECVHKCNLLPIDGETVVGFKNTQCKIVHNNERFMGATDVSKKNNFYAMNFVGPLLIRNPYFTNMLVEELFKQKGYDYSAITDTCEFQEYNEFIKLFIKRDNLD